MVAVSFRLEPLDKDIKAILNRDFSREAQSKAAAAFAREEIAKVDAANEAALKRKLDYETFVNGAKSTNLESVNPDGGTIAAVWDLLIDSFEWIEEQLILHSPYRTGRYAKSHLFFADGVEANPASPPPADVYEFVNAQPYSRKIERGLSKQSPDGVYQVVAALASTRFGNSSQIRFGYQSLLGGYQKYVPASAGKRAAHQAERATRNPAIRITPRTGK